MLTVRIIEDGARFAALRAAWHDVLECTAGRHVFMTYEWASTWWGHFGTSCDLYVVVVEDAGRVVGLAPFAATRPGSDALWGRVLRPIGQEHADYGGFPLGERADETGRAVLDHLEKVVATSNTVVEFLRVWDDAPWFALLTGRFRGLANVTLDANSFTPNLYIDLATPPDPVAHVAKLARRHDVPREYRRLGRDFAVQFEYHTSASIADGMHTLLKLSDLRWRTKSEAMGGLFADQRSRAFAVDVADALDRAGHARLSMITADGRPVASSIGYEYGGVFSWHKTGLDPTFQTYSPGHAILALMLEEVARRRLVEFNFGRGDEPYKLRWTNGSRQLVNLTLRRRGALGKAQRWARSHSRN